MPDGNNTIDFFSAVQISSLQDTSITKRDSIPLILDNSIILNEKQNLQEFNLQTIDSILKKSEERERQILQTIKRDSIVKRYTYKKTVDTTELLYKQFGISGFPIQENLDRDPFNQNVLYNFLCIKPKESDLNQSVFIEADKISHKASITQITKTDLSIKSNNVSQRISFDWVTILLMVSFLLLGWVQLFYKKYLISHIKSIVLYKESSTLFREKNSVMTKASFLINLLFISNISIFFLQLKYIFNVQIGELDDYVIYLALFVSFIAFNIFRLISASAIGYLFLKQKVFSEYIHSVYIFSKNTGIFLFPVIIALQFLPVNNLEPIAYAGIIVIIILYLFQLIRSFQIIIRKNVSIFFMILYLCAFEFAPFLVIYKMLLS